MIFNHDFSSRSDFPAAGAGGSTRATGCAASGIECHEVGSAEYHGHLESAEDLSPPLGSEPTTG